MALKKGPEAIGNTENNRVPQKRCPAQLCLAALSAQLTKACR
jgi:hypothetical protein